MKKSMFSHWGYFYVAFELVGRDITKMSYWDDKNIIEFFNLMAFRKDLIDDDARKQREEMKMR